MWFNHSKRSCRQPINTALGEIIHVIARFTSFVCFMPGTTSPLSIVWPYPSKLMVYTEIEETV